MKIASQRALDDMDIAAELRVQGATWDTIARVLGRRERVLHQMGTTGTTLLSTSRTRRKVHMRKVLCLAPEVVRAAPDHNCPYFLSQSLGPGWNRSWGCGRPGRNKAAGAPALRANCTTTLFRQGLPSSIRIA